MEGDLSSSIDIIFMAYGKTAYFPVTSMGKGYVYYQMGVWSAIVVGMAMIVSLLICEMQSMEINII